MDATQVAAQVTELAYALDTFYFLVMGALVMWMAAGFTMLEAGLVRAKNTAEILTKNVGLYSIACIMFMLSGYTIMYPGDFAGGVFASLSTLGSGLLGSSDNTAADVIASGGDTYYSNLSDFFFQVVFVATAMSIVSGAVAERMKLWSFFIFAVVLTAVIYPVQGFWNWGGGFLTEDFGYFDFAGSGTVHLCGAAAALAGVISVANHLSDDVTPIRGDEGIVQLNQQLAAFVALESGPLSEIVPQGEGDIRGAVEEEAGPADQSRRRLVAGSGEQADVREELAVAEEHLGAVDPHLGLGRPVAIKVLRGDLASDPERL